MDNYTDFEIECFDYLERLRQSGVTNMFGACPYLERRFKISPTEASRVLSKWMRNYEDIKEMRGWGDDIPLTYRDIVTSIPVYLDEWDEDEDEWDDEDEED